MNVGVAIEYSLKADGVMDDEWIDVDAVVMDEVVIDGWMMERGMRQKPKI